MKLAFSVLFDLKPIAETKYKLIKILLALFNILFIAKHS